MKGGDRKEFFMTTIKDLKKQLEKTIRDAFVIKNGEIIKTPKLGIELNNEINEKAFGKLFEK